MKELIFMISMIAIPFVTICAESEYQCDSIIGCGQTSINVGKIHEEDGIIENSFWMKNVGSSPTEFIQGYTSCGCTAIDFEKGKSIQPGDSTCVTLRFNPTGKYGDFIESGKLIYGNDKKCIDLSINGYCVTSEESLKKQFPYHLSKNTWVSAERFDLGILNPGKEKTVYITVLHRNLDNLQETVPIKFVTDANMGTGLKHITKSVIIREKEKEINHKVVFDVIIR